MRGVSARGERGFSLLELMIAVVILGVISSQMFVMLSTQKRSATSSSRDMDLQEAARLVSELISFDTRNAGMMVPAEAAVASFDGGSSGPDRLCVSSNGYFNVRSPSLWDTRNERFAGATLDALVPNATTVLAKDTAELDIDRDVVPLTSANDWNPTPGGGAFPPVGIIIARTDGTGSFCARVINIVGRTFTLDPSHQIPSALTGGTAIAVPAIIYELQDISPTAGDDLSLLLRNGIAVSGQLEDLQVEYWVDTLGTSGAGGVLPDGEMDVPGEFPVSVLLNLPKAISANHKPLTRIRNVRVSVMARSPLPDLDSQGILRGIRPALGNRTGGDRPDSFSRRAYTVSVLPRNLMRADDYSQFVD